MDVLKDAHQPLLPLDRLGTVVGILLDDVAGGLVELFVDPLAVGVGLLIAFQEPVHRLVVGIAHSDEQEMPVVLYELVELGEKKDRGPELPDGFEEFLFLGRQDGVGRHLPLHVHDPLEVAVHINFLEAFLYPVFQVGVFALVEGGVIRGKLVDLSAVVVHAPQDFQPCGVFQELHRQEVLRFVRQQRMGEIGEFLQLVAHSVFERAFERARRPKYGIFGKNRDAEREFGPKWGRVIFPRSP